MKKCFYIFFCLLVISFSCNNNQSRQKDEQRSDTVSTIKENPPPVLEIQTDKSIDFRIFQNDNQSWGYDIYVEGRLYVHQPHIPAVSGTLGFRTAEDARKTAEYISYKLEKDRSLPGVSIRELDSLNVLP